MSSAEYSCKIFKPFFCILANSVVPDQTAPDLGPHCLQNRLLKSQADDKAVDNCCDWHFKGFKIVCRTLEMIDPDRSAHLLWAFTDCTFSLGEVQMRPL